MPLVKIKDFNALIDNEPFFDQLVKNQQEAYEELIEMSRNYILLVSIYQDKYEYSSAN